MWTWQEAVGGLGVGLGDDCLDVGEVGVHEGGEDRGDGPLDVADLVVLDVVDGDGVAVVLVERLADEPHGLAAGDLAAVVAHADDVGHDEAHEVALVVVVAAAAMAGGGGHGGGGKGEGLGRGSWGLKL